MATMTGTLTATATQTGRPRKASRVRFVWILAALLVGGTAVSASPARGASPPARTGTAEPVSFVHDVLPILSKHGCSSGPCHGSPNGKGGFRLSLRAFDPELDRETLLRETFARRWNPFDPDTSLILLKPTGAVSHGGGIRLKRSDRSYSILSRWIAEGASTALPAARLAALHVSPQTRELELPDRTVSLSVEAELDDGSRRGVTHLAVFTSSDEDVATVDANGRVEARRRGEVAILVRYLDQLATAVLTFTEQVEGFVWPESISHGFIDDLVLAKLRKLSFTPAPIASDAIFVRRVHLDVLGRLPTPDETRAFLADPREDRRDLLIDRLLADPAHARYWASRWADILRVTEQGLSRGGAFKLHAWLVRSVERNEPYDEFARRLLTAGGSTLSEPAAGFFRVAADAQDLAESVSQVFLGSRLTCAKCHNHPFERWTQDDYYGMTAFFARVRTKRGPRPDESIVWNDREGETRHLGTQEIVAPAWPLAGPAEVPPGSDRRAALARWLTAPGNPFFARVEANRVWFHLFGRGIVHPVDDFRDSNPPANAELLDALARRFEESGFDRRELLRQILRSATYQRSATIDRFNADDSRYFSRAYPRLLPAETLLDAVVDVCGVDQRFRGLPPGTRAAAMPVPDRELEFLKLFGQPERRTVCQCERSDETSLGKALEMLNGALVQGMLRDPRGRLRRRLASDASDGEIVSELWMTALSREPLAGELAEIERYIASRESREAAFEDVLWALLNSNEMLFQH